MFSSCVLVFEIFLIRLVREEIKISKKEGILFLLTMLGVMMLRQNGMYVVAFSLPVLLLEKDRRKRRKTALLFCGAIVLYLSYTHILFPALDITPGSRREMLSVPFQQTARYVRDYADEVTEEERDAIDRVLDYDTIGEVYDPNISDPVKKTFNEDADSEDLKAYFKVWFQMFLKHPVSVGYFPVCSIARKGPHTGCGEKAFSNTVPSSAMQSRFGVISSFWP